MSSWWMGQRYGGISNFLKRENGGGKPSCEERDIEVIAGGKGEAQQGTLVTFGDRSDGSCVRIAAAARTARSKSGNTLKASVIRTD
ncbi:hypothetical protein EYF80_036264 [Liparis tanakae]|uniref:Uncharacterized protein n=1 Tax=Liparis tanakae TaxID=230148 RepID=A0A4Z2GJW3_9TELE|nr:hypothetical protein EYF80_036264 [Liparis tanakae]